jgi:hypothetical protein
MFCKKANKQLLARDFQIEELVQFLNVWGIHLHRSVAAAAWRLGCCVTVEVIIS